LGPEGGGQVLGPRGRRTGPRDQRAEDRSLGPEGGGQVLGTRGLRTDPLDQRAE
jgi:hypothetical protein